MVEVFGGGVSSSRKSQDIRRLVGLVIPVFLIFYGILIQYGILEKTFYISDAYFFTLMGIWLIVAIFQYLYRVKSKPAAFVRIVSYHALAAAYFLGVSGFAMPFIACWVILSLATYAYFSDDGLRLNIMVLFALAAGDSIIHYASSDIQIRNVMTLIAVLVVVLATVALMKVQEANSRQKTANEADEHLQRDSILTLVNNLADAVLSTDADGKITVYNAASLGLLDTNDNIAAKHIDDVLTLYDKDEKVVRFSELLKASRGVTILDTLTTNIGGEDVRLELTYSPIRGGYSAETKNSGYIIILRDITKAKSLEEERDEFISVVSHELRTPITIAEGTISNALVMFERDDIHDDLLKEGLITAHDQVIYLAKMVNDLSTLSRAERGVAAEIEDIDVREMVNELYNSYQDEAKKKGLHLDLDVKGQLGVVSTSRLYLHELLQNFITNAIKYTKEGSVTFTVTKKAGKVTFTVSDTGIGISKADQAKIFNKFYRAEDYRTRETSGTGLGLYVAAKLAKKIGAVIKLSSRLNHGSKFSITLPAKTKD